MRQEFEAIYENGVLRPLQPVGLREHEVVFVSVTGSRLDDALIAEQQRAGLLAFITKVQASPGPPAADGLSNRDHDQIIYEPGP